MFRKIVSFALIALLAIFAPLLAACQPQSEKIGENDARAPESGNPGEDTPPFENPKYMGYVFPDLDYGGYEVTILNPDPEVIVWMYTEMVVEVENGDVVNDAIYKRNTQIEEALGVKFKEKRDNMGNVAAILNRAIAADSDEYDIVFLSADSTGSFVTQGKLLNLYDMPELSLGSPWWDQNSQRSLSLDGKLHMVATPAHLAFFGQLWCTYFNKRLIMELGFDDPYVLLGENRWTYGKFFEMAKAAALDMDGDGTWGINDRWGAYINANLPNGFLHIINESTIQMDSSGVPALKSPTERLIGAIEMIKQYYPKNDGILAPSDHAMFQGRGNRGDFPNGNALFFMDNLGTINGFRNMEDDFGILPVPKLDESQESYCTWPGSWGPLLVVPATAGDPGRTAVIANALSAVTADTTLPAYYEINIQRKAARDEDSLTTLEILRESVNYDIGLIYGWTQLLAGYAANIVGGSGSGSPVAVYERLEGAAKAAIEKTMNELGK
ncbi:MAG: hypothetical protein FWG34_11355 [Oscillospiraceae bacterium]|nr:hypothetical protein [Oscillospiraceae bacterium]